MKGYRLFFCLIVIVLLAAGCHFPTGGEDAPIPSVDTGDDAPVDEPVGPSEGEEDAPLTTADIVATQQAGMAPAPDLLTLIGIADGDTLVAGIPAPGAMPLVSFQVETHNYDFVHLALEADGQEVYKWQVTANEGNVLRDISWVPWHGNGEYALMLRILETDGTTLVEEALTVTVEGIPAGTPTVSELFTQKFQEFFGITVPSPVYSHVHDEWETTDSINQWSSAVYQDEWYYWIDLFDDGRYLNGSGRIADGPSTGDGVCPAKGVYEVLVVIVDYHNTGVTNETIQYNMTKNTTEVNALWADYSASIGLPEPIVQIIPTYVYLDAPPNPGGFLNEQLIWEKAGLQVSDWDLVAQVDLDSEKSSLGGQAAGAMAFPGFCNSTPPGGINMIAWVRGPATSENIGGTLWEHEFLHLLGWRHEWMSGDGGTLDRYNLGRQFPYRYLGWADIDGDGIIEINDPTPYGMN